MIALLKINVPGKIFGKICQKVIRDTFFQTCALRSGEGRGTGGDIQQKGKVQTLIPEGGPPPPIPSLSVTV